MIDLPALTPVLSPSELRWWHWLIAAGVSATTALAIILDIRDRLSRWGWWRRRRRKGKR